MKQTTLRDLAAPSGLVGGPFGSNLVSADYTDDGVPVIRGDNLSSGKWVDGDFVYVSDLKFRSDLARNAAVAGDLVFTQRGTLGQVALVPAGAHPTYVISQSQMRLRVDQSKAVEHFLYYACSAPEFRKQIADRAITTGVPHVNLGILGELAVPLPPLPTQRAIAEVLGALDDKIAANATVDWLAEGMLSAEFRALQVRSDAVAVRVTELVEFNPSSNKLSSPEATYVDMKSLPTSGAHVPAWERRPPIGGARFMNGDTLLARITPCLENRKTGYVDFLADDETAVGSTEFIVLRSRLGLAKPLSFLVAIDAEFRSHAIQHMVGTSGRQRVSARDLADFEFQLPNDPSALSGLGARAQALFELGAARRTESRHLANLRDTLLPHLMSGRITVRDAENQVGAAL